MESAPHEPADQLADYAEQLLAASGLTSSQLLDLARQSEDPGASASADPLMVEALRAGWNASTQPDAATSDEGQGLR